MAVHCTQKSVFYITFECLWKKATSGTNESTRFRRGADEVRKSFQFDAERNEICESKPTKDSETSTAIEEMANYSEAFFFLSSLKIEKWTTKNSLFLHLTVNLNWRLKLFRSSFALCARCRGAKSL